MTVELLTGTTGDCGLPVMESPAVLASLQTRLFERSCVIDCLTVVL